MAGVLNDSEEQRLLDRTRRMTYREIRDEIISRTGNSFVGGQWISEKVHRGESWVRRIWNKTTEECYTQFGNGGPKILSQESKNMSASVNGVSCSSSRKVAKENFWREQEIA